MRQSLRTSRGFGFWIVRPLALLLCLIGLVFLAGGAWLVWLGGSAYYVPAGLGLFIAGVLLFRMRAAGVWLYGLVFLLTIAWAFWEAGLNGWALVPRMVAPAVLLVFVLMSLPVVRPQVRWASALLSIALLIVAAVAIGFALPSLAGKEAVLPLQAASSALDSQKRDAPIQSHPGLRRCQRGASLGVGSGTA